MNNPEMFGGGEQAYGASGMRTDQRNSQIADTKARILVKLAELRKQYPTLPFTHIWELCQQQNRDLFDTLKKSEIPELQQTISREAALARSMLLSEMTIGQIVQAAMNGGLK